MKKVGDNVMCIDNNNGRLSITINKVYTITDVKYSSLSDKYMYYVIDDENLSFGYYTERFVDDIKTIRKQKLINIKEKTFSAGDIVAYKRYDYEDGSSGRDTTPPFFEIIKVDDLSRAWYGDDCIGTAYIRHATEFEIEWYKRITNPRKTKLDKLNNL